MSNSPKKILAGCQNPPPSPPHAKICMAPILELLVLGCIGLGLKRPKLYAWPPERLKRRWRSSKPSSVLKVYLQKWISTGCNTANAMWWKWPIAMHCIVFHFHHTLFSGKHQILNAGLGLHFWSQILLRNLLYMRIECFYLLVCKKCSVEIFKIFALECILCAHSNMKQVKCINLN